MDRQPVLVATEGPLKGARYPVGTEGLSLGRGEDCEVLIADPNVSRYHARLVLHNAALWVQDAGSRNGVFVNETRVVRHRQLSPGDALMIGVHGFTLELDAVLEPESSVAMPAVRPPSPDASPLIIKSVLLALVLSGLGAAVWLVLR
jgi:pSer/pThr/pTyr-binding forkhead associated (FHA) protein